VADKPSTETKQAESKVDDLRPQSSMHPAESRSSSSGVPGVEFASLQAAAGAIVEPEKKAPPATAEAPVADLPAVKAVGVSSQAAVSASASVSVSASAAAATSAPVSVDSSVSTSVSRAQESDVKQLQSVVAGKGPTVTAVVGGPSTRRTMRSQSASKDKSDGDPGAAMKTPKIGLRRAPSRASDLEKPTAAASDSLSSRCMRSDNPPKG
jgi:hypothetical protein